MKKTLLTITIIVLSFGLGFAVSNYIHYLSQANTKERKATSIGGIFFKCKDPAKVRAWYREHLGLNTNKYGTVFEWRHAEDSTKRGFTQWSPFKETTNYFKPSEKEFMINYRVENLKALVEQFKRDSVTVTDTIESVSYGKFVHIMDIEGNKIELWEPNDEEYGKMSVEGGVTK